jgi:hypothetical protein
MSLKILQKTIRVNNIQEVNNELNIKWLFGKLIHLSLLSSPVTSEAQS